MNSAIIVAAGSGKRMGIRTPKQFIEIDGVSILAHTLRKFVQSGFFEEFIIVLSPDHWEEGEILQEALPENNILLCKGGKERFHSVKNALAEVSSNCQNVFIHDSVRPFFSGALLQNCLTTCQNHSSAIPAISLKDSIRSIKETGESEIESRANFRSIQTPQAFDYKKLQKAYQNKYDDSFTDDASVYEAAGHSVHLINGECGNFKITTPDDLKIARILLSD